MSGTAARDVGISYEYVNVDGDIEWGTIPFSLAVSENIQIPEKDIVIDLKDRTMRIGVK